MPNDWYERWDDAVEERNFDNWNRRNMNRHLRGDPQNPPDDDWEFGMKDLDDYYARKYGPDPIDVAVARQRELAEQAQDEDVEAWLEDRALDLTEVEAREPDEPPDWDEDNGVDEALMARYDDDPNPYHGTYSEE